MALNSNAFVEGIDPTGTFGGYASVLLQLSRQALPSSTYGMILFDSATPDVAGANAWRKRCVWIDTTSLVTPGIKVYRDSGSPGWISLFTLIPAASITGSMIASHTVTLANLSVSGGTAGQVIRVDSGATGFEFVNFSSLFTAGVVPLTSLNVGSLPPPSTDIYLLTAAGGATNVTTVSLNTVANQISPGTLVIGQLAGATTPTAKAQFASSTNASALAAWRYFTPATDLDDGGVSGIKITSNTLAVTKLVPGSEGQIVKVVGGVATWAAAAAGATFQEDFVFATNNFDFPSATGTTNVDIPITLPASREWKDVEIILSGNLLITNFGIITFNLQWNTAPETGSVAITSAGGCGRNTWTATGTSALGTTFPFELRWKGIVPASIKATNITIRLNFVGSTFLVSSNSRYEICARATANV